MINRFKVPPQLDKLYITLHFVKNILVDLICSRKKGLVNLSVGYGDLLLFRNRLIYTQVKRVYGKGSSGSNVAIKQLVGLIALLACTPKLFIKCLQLNHEL